MPQYIAYESDDKTVVETLCSGVTPEQLAGILRLAPGAWREITQDEACDVQRPTGEEKEAVRLAEILARLAKIDADSVRPLRALAQGRAGDYEREKLAALDAEAETLRKELRKEPVTMGYDALPRADADAKEGEEGFDEQGASV